MITIVGSEAEAGLLAQAAREAELEAATVVEAPGTATSAAALAQRLRELEETLTSQPPDAVVLADDTDTALAALLVAAKLCVPVAAAGGTAAASPNSRLIAQLVDRRLDR